MQLARGDSVAAEKAFREWGSCCDANEVQTLETLIQVIVYIYVIISLLSSYKQLNLFQAYDDEDPDLARQALASPFIRHMDVEYAILARDLNLPKGLSVPPKVTVIENAAASYISKKEHSPEQAEVCMVFSNICSSIFY